MNAEEKRVFDLQKYYDMCNSGELVNNDELWEYLEKFETIIIRGASFLGKALGRELIRKGLQIECYWDARYEEVCDVDGIPINMPFDQEYDRKSTLVILAIGNHTIQGGLLNELVEQGYQHIRGDILYSGIICRFCNGNKLSAKQCWESNECRPLVCGRATSIIKNCNQKEKPGDRIDFTYIAFIVNNICNLKCKYCFQYINNYEPRLRENVPLRVLCHDADVFMNTIDSTGSITVMGGETFLHPELGEFLKHLCKHDNFGFISVASNGLVPIQEKQLEGMTDKRIAVNFGSYLHVASEQEKENYYRNIELVKSYGITYTESVKLPHWTVPTTLYELDVDLDYKINRKQSCAMPPRDLQIKNGKVHVCDMSLALHNMGLRDYPRDYMDLNVDRSLEENRQELRRLINEPYYESCGHCNSCGADAGEGGTQGERNIFSPE